MCKFIFVSVIRLAKSGSLQSAFESSIGVLKCTCDITRIVPWYQTVVQSLQLVLKLAEILEMKLRREVSIFYLYFLLSANILTVINSLWFSLKKVKRRLTRELWRSCLLCSSGSVSGEMNCCRNHLYLQKHSPIQRKLRYIADQNYNSDILFCYN